MGIQILPPEMCTHIDTHSQLCTVSPPPAPRGAPQGDLQLQKRTGSFPELVPGSRQGPGAGEGAQPRAKTPRPAPARRPPSPWMPVWCAMAPCPAPPAPSEPSARPWPGSAGLDPEEEEDVAGAAQPRSASRAVSQDPPPALPAPTGAAGGRGLGPRVRARCACVWRSRWRACGGACVGDCARVSVWASGSEWSVAGAGSCARERESVRPRPGGFARRVAGRADSLSGPQRGSACGWACVRLCGIPRPGDVS